MTTRSFPKGVAYWTLSRSAEQACEASSLAAAATGESEVSLRLGTVLSLLYRTASCYWGCHGKEHVLEYLAGRTCTSAHAAYRLIGFGYYDEAISLSRSVSEIGNLVQLFFIESSHLRRWLDLPDDERRRAYGPINVRKTLESLGTVVPTDQDQYAWLCEVGTHVTPRTMPQSHNAESRPILGAVFQRDGWKVAVESLAWSVCTVAAPLSKLALLDRSHAERLFEESIALARAL
jgi:hypothetical protein